MIHEIEAKKLLITNKHPSSWFGVKYYLNIYRGCTHGCIYCDSRSECYKIDNFDTDISIKINSIDLLKKELSAKRYRETIGFGSTSDPYIPIEKNYELTKQALNVVKELKFPLFLITKSNLIVRDTEIISQINKQNYACIAFTITTTDDELAKIIEPHAPLPSERLKAMSILAVMGIKVGVIVMPTLPYITDTEENIINIVKQAKLHDASFVYSSFGVTLRDRQREYFYSKISDDIKNKYIDKYKNYYSCTSPNYRKLKIAFINACKEYNISSEMPSYAKENSIAQLNLFTQ